MTQYEYHVLDLHEGVEDHHVFKRLLDDLGAQGWLLVLETGDELIFVRPKPNPATEVHLVWGTPQEIPERN